MRTARVSDNAVARNIEIKATVFDMNALEARARSLADQGPIDIYQDDTFFNCDVGRLKLRKFDQSSGELIFYRRADESGPKESFYLRSETTTPDALRESLAMAYGVCGRVEKHRMLYLAGRTRIHLDRVTGLGNFMELEVVLEDSDSVTEGAVEARALMAALGVHEESLVQGAYVDLLAKRDS